MSSEAIFGLDSPDSLSAASVAAQQIPNPKHHAASNGEGSERVGGPDRVTVYEKTPWPFGAEGCCREESY
jgi:hypothetical protein